MKNWISLLVVLSSVFFIGCTSSNRYSHRSSTTSKPEIVKPAIKLGDDQYMVKQGDTLFSIAFMNGIDYRTLALINNIDPNTAIIHPGDILTVKIKGLNTQNVYRVKGGDTLFSIAKNHHTTVANLAKINKINPPYTINLGQLIVLDNSKKIYDKVTPTQNKTQSVAATKPTTTTTNPPKKETPQVVKNEQSAYNKQSKLSWKWPTKGTIINNYVKNSNSGIDIAGTKGQNIVSAANGKVVYAGNALRGYGNLIIIKHNDDYLSAYAHNDKLLVKETQSVKAGQVIAKMGSTDSDRVNLHFEIRYRGEAVNPNLYLPRK